MSGSHNPLISVLIPTREHAITLRSTLETVLEQDNRDFEVVVSDNHSSDNTASVVRQFDDQRLRYVDTGRRLSMCDNFEFALSHARGSYVVAIGDDDGLMRGAIGAMNGMICSMPRPLYQWSHHTYMWPTGGQRAHVDYLAPRSARHAVDLRKLVASALAWGGVRWSRLPSIYHSLVEKRLLAQIAERTGRVFHSTQPDVFLGFTLPALVDTALDTGLPLSVAGRSVPYFSRRIRASDEHQPAVQKAQRFLDEYSNYQMHRTLVQGYGIANMIPDAILVAMDLYPEYYRGVRFNYSAAWAWEQAFFNFSSVAEILRIKSQIMRVQPFSSVDFLWRYAVCRAYSLRIDARTAMTRHRSQAPSAATVAGWVAQQPRVA